MNNNPAGEAREWRPLYAALVLLVAAGFLYRLLPILSPIVLFAAALIMVAPFAGTKQHRILVITLSLLLAVWLLKTLAGLLAPFILALVIAFILDPLVDRLEARGLRRPFAVAAVMLPLIAALVLICVFGIPAVIDQAEDAFSRLPAALERVVKWAQAQRAALERLPFFRSGGGSGALESFSTERVAAYLQARQAQIINNIWSAVLGVGKGVSIALSLVGYFVLVPVLIIYLLLDYDGMTRRAVSLIPPRYRPRLMPLLREYNTLLARYFRGQFIAALIVGVLTWLGLMILGFPYSGLVGAIAGVFNLVPYLGLVASIIPAVLIAVMSGSVVASLVKAGIVFFVVQLIDGTITGPRIVGGSVGLHPVWVILALAVGSFFLGFVGLLLAMPVGVLIKLLLREAIAHYRSSRLFTETSADSAAP